MFCPQCGKEVSDSAKFCPGCGKQFKKQKSFQGVAGKEERRRKSASSEAGLLSSVSLKQSLPQMGIYLGILFGVSLVLVAILLACAKGLSGLEEYMIHVNLFDPRTLFALLPLAFGGSVALTLDPSLGAGSSAAAGILGAGADGIGGLMDSPLALGGLLSGGVDLVNSLLVEAWVQFPVLLIGLFSTVAAVVYAVRFSKDKELYARNATLAYAIIVALGGVLIYGVIQFLFPAKISLPGALLTASGLTLQAVLALFLWIFLTVLLSEGLRQTKVRHGSLSLSRLSENRNMLGVYQNSLFIFGVVLLASVIFFCAMLAGNDLLLGILSGLATLCFTPLAFVGAALFLGSSVTSSFNYTGFAMLGGNQTNGLNLAEAPLPTGDLSLYSAFGPELGPLVVLGCAFLYIILVIVFSLIRYRTYENFQFNIKESLRFAATAALIWILIGFFTTISFSTDAEIIVGAGFSMSFALAWYTFFFGAIFAFLIDFLAGYGLPRLIGKFTFLDTFVHTKGIALLGGYSYLGQSEVSQAASVPASIQPETQSFSGESSLRSAGQSPQVSHATTAVQAEGTAFRSAVASPGSTPKKNNKKTLIVAGSVAGALVLGFIVVQVLGATVFSPQAQVGEYFNAIAQGDIARASALADPRLDSKEEALLAEDLLADPKNRISEVSVEGGEDDKYRVEYTLGGSRYQTEVSTRKAGPLFVFFTKYEIENPAILNISLGESLYGDTVLVNGVEFSIPEEKESSQVVMNIPLYPGIYSLSQEENEYIQSDTLALEVAHDGEDGLSSDLATIHQFTLSFTEKTNTEVKDLVEQHLKAWMAESEEDFPGVSVSPKETYFYWGTRSFTGWSNLVMPTVVPLEGEERLASGKSPLRLAGGELYYGAAEDGEVTGSFVGSWSGDAQYEYILNSFDLFLRMNDEGLTLVDGEGKVLHGLDGSYTPSSSVNQETEELAEAVTGYIFADSTGRYLGESDLEGKTDYELYIARNEILARHGREFSNADLREHFGAQDWYQPTTSAEEFDAVSLESRLNQYELKNLYFIREVEQQRGSSYLA